MVIEAVFEDINIKHAVLKEVEAVSVTEIRLNRLKKLYISVKGITTCNVLVTIGSI